MSHRAFDGYTSPKTVNGVDGYNTVIRAQSALGSGTLGGDLVLTSGTGTTRDGYVRIGSYSTERITVGPDSVVITGATLSEATLDKIVDIVFDGYELTPSITQEDQPIGGNDGYTLLIKAQNSLVEPGNGGNLNLESGDGYSGGGDVFITSGDGYTNGGNVFINAGDGYSGGYLSLTTGDGYNGDGIFRDGYIAFSSGAIESARVITNKFVLSAGQRIYLANVATTPFNVPDGYFTMMVNTSSIAITINLPANPVVGDLYQVKDSTGNANTNNITIQGNGYNIDGGPSYTMSASYGTVLFVFNGTRWSVL